MVRVTNYEVATNFIGNMVLCNEIVNFDESIYDNVMFDWETDDGESRDIYQFYIIDSSESQVKWLKGSFPSLLFSYSEKLGTYILCVDHWGTLWSAVEIECHNDDLILD